MQALLVVALVLHVLSGVFWAGSTFTLARGGGAGAEKLFRPQMGAAVIAVVTGGVLWHLAHSGSPGKTEYILAAGAVAAIIAAGVQGMGVGRAARMLVRADQAELSRLQSRMAVVQRVAAVLLGVAVICMAAARYA
jgi:uncharacterized membrane protein